MCPPCLILVHYEAPLLLIELGIEHVGTTQLRECIEFLYVSSSRLIVLFCAVTTLLPTPDMTTTLTSGATTEDINTTTDGTGQLTPSFVLFSLVLSLSLIIL